MAGPAAILLWESGAAQQKIADRVRGRKAQSKDGINRYDRRRGKLAADVLPKAKKRAAAWLLAEGNHRHRARLGPHPWVKNLPLDKGIICGRISTRLETKRLLMEVRP